MYRYQPPTWSVVRGVVRMTLWCAVSLVLTVFTWVQFDEAHCTRLGEVCDDVPDATLWLVPGSWVVPVVAAIALTVRWALGHDGAVGIGLMVAASYGLSFVVLIVCYSL